MCEINKVKLDVGAKQKVIFLLVVLFLLRYSEWNWKQI